MNLNKVKVPFVDLSLQNQPLAEEINAAIQKVITTGDFILGDALNKFEQSFAELCEVEYGVGVASGTDAIALGLQACEIGAGDEVIVPTNTFIATIMGILDAGATPVLVDCDPFSALIDLNKAEKAVTSKTKAIVPVHLYGQMVSPTKLLDFAQAHNLLIFEDAAQAHLAKREGYTAGSVGIASAFSFYPSKNLGSFGNGGMVVTKSEEIAQKIKTLRNYGAAKKYWHSELGKNSRLDTLQAAILQVKLPHLCQWNLERNQAAVLYDQCLQDIPWINPIKNYSDSGHIYHLYVVAINPEFSLNRSEVQKKLSDFGIQTGIHYPIPCHLQPAYQNLGYQYGDFPVAEALSTQIFSLPMYPGLSHSLIKLICELLSKIG